MRSHTYKGKTLPVARMVAHTLMHRLPNLLRSRHGVYYLRASRRRQIKRSLRTKDFARASISLTQSTSEPQ